ncbi:MAG: peroxide stress protein YaaA [Limosilactobacillus sp.]|jgi:cytoplasmic iron level regulating protein YaaA (DUF328/UPF0246 family)|uniref:peroxide stress protein YaaA n=1 Tax=Limosilactobacillus sp. TaxID=2773925 RepID=UPI0025BC34FA|nr:peroxide stress protein YaaA [Limosilactobacillus sp.]MCI1974789.1 peroxide stress protein YaaA [Limosilactobacillus sp.]MCI2030856.1 peroxide stress protein YaaA [Limosilactobacillus sp.]
MKIIISPARTMKQDQDSLPYQELPQYLKKSQTILDWMRTLNFKQLHQLWWNCSERLANLNYRRVKDMELTRNLTPAILAFQGLQYQYIGAGVMTEKELDYLQSHLRILSGFYGILKPFDGIVPYRLGMGDRAKIGQAQNLYEFWGNQLYQNLYQDDDLVVNLASNEYSKAITPFLKPQDQMITCVFGELINGKIKQKATLAKMARGNMVRFLAESGAETAADLKKFSVGGYCFRPDLSTEQKFCFELQK